MPMNYGANRNVMQTSNSSSSMQSSSSESKSFSSSVNRSSTTASNSRYNMEDSRNITRGVDDSRHYVEDGRQPYYEDEQGRNLEIESLPDERALPPPTQPPAQQQAPPPSQAGPSQPARGTSFAPKKNNVRIVGGKLLKSYHRKRRLILPEKFNYCFQLDSINSCEESDQSTCFEECAPT